MEELSGRLTAKLAARDETYDEALIDEINRSVQPPRPLTANEVYIRAMYIVSDEVNSQGGRFEADELTRLAELLIDSPVMIGHKRDSLPVARNFKAQRVEIDGRPWVKSYFYWLKESDGAGDLKSNIDGGIYKECSISFLFGMPECSVCGGDIRGCRHIPFREYQGENGETVIAHFIYRQIEKVLETSLVFRGAVPDTSITDRLSPVDDDDENEFTKDGEEENDGTRRGFCRARVVFGLPEAASDDSPPRYCLPHQPGLSLSLTKTETNIDIESSLLLSEMIRRQVERLARALPVSSCRVEGVLFATHGRERQRGLGLLKIFEAETSLHRLRFRICNATEIDGRAMGGDELPERLDILRRLLGDSPPPGLAVAAPQLLGRDETGDGIMKRAQEYRYGLEIVEDSNGVLRRYLVSGNEIVPAVIEDVADRRGGFVACRLRAIGAKPGQLQAVSRRMAGLETGAVVAVRPGPAKAGSVERSATLIDVLPGLDAGDVAVSAKEIRRPRRMLMRQEPRRLYLLVPESEGWLRICIFHYSRSLFERGRRFVADVSREDTAALDEHNWREVSLDRVTRVGQLLRLAPCGESPVFGACAGIWLRPVILDGEERYLLYRDGVSRRKAGL